MESDWSAKWMEIKKKLFLTKQIKHELVDIQKHANQELSEILKARNAIFGKEKQQYVKDPTEKNRQALHDGQLQPFIENGEKVVLIWDSFHHIAKKEKTHRNKENPKEKVMPFVDDKELPKDVYVITDNLIAFGPTFSFNNIALFFQSHL